MSEPRKRAPLTVLVADDDDDLRALVVDNPSQGGLPGGGGARRGGASRPPERGARRFGGAPDVVLTDVLMPKMSGIGILEAVRRAHWNIPVILMTVLGDSSVHTLARKLAAVGVLRKPLGTDDVKTAVLSAAHVRVRPAVARRKSFVRSGLPRGRSLVAVLVIAFMGAASPLAHAYTIKNELTDGCHEAITTAALRACAPDAGDGRAPPADSRRAGAHRTTCSSFRIRTCRTSAARRCSWPCATTI